MRRHLTAPPAIRTVKRRVARLHHQPPGQPARALGDRAREAHTGWALLETTGRRSGRPRRTPVGNGLRGDTFWIVTEHGWSADYVKNIQADPRVRVKVGGAWRSGTAHILEDEDPYERLKVLGRPVNDALPARRRHRAARAARRPRLSLRRSVARR
jgi:deazaflavin-dependent oxidoreductase (nitroreductase family)